MKLSDHIEMLASITGEAGMTIKQNTTLRCNIADGMAGKLLLWLHEQLPDDATLGEAEDILDAAKWWLIFYAATGKLEKDTTP